MGFRTPASEFAVSELPFETGQFWPCVPTEADPPSFTGFAYVTSGGMSSVNSAAGGTSCNWQAVRRFAPDDITKLFRAQFYYRNTSAALGDATVGFSVGANRVGFRHSPGFFRATCDGVEGANIAAAPWNNAYVHVTVELSLTLTRITLNRDPSLRSEVAAGVAAGLGSWLASNNNAQGVYVSSLFVDFDTVLMP